MVPSYPLLLFPAMYTLFRVLTMKCSFPQLISRGDYSMLAFCIGEDDSRVKVVYVRPLPQKYRSDMRMFYLFSEFGNLIFYA